MKEEHELEELNNSNIIPRAARYGEGTFCIIYLMFVIAIAVYTSALYKGYSSLGEDVIFPAIGYRYGFGFMLAVLLGIGDAFHLIPRIIVCFKGSMWKQDFFLGLGSLISSITMTFFYNILIMLGDSLEYNELEYNYGIEEAILYLTIIRFLILLLPMNKWYTKEGSRKWAVIRNVPFIIIGILTVIGFLNVISNAYTMPAAFYMIIIVTVILSFIFYLPVAINGKKNPKLGMLMIPKTICYMIMLGVIAFW
jgi:hypothetical protein